jgi:hypothetical protein
MSNFPACQIWRVIAWPPPLLLRDMNKLRKRLVILTSTSRRNGRVERVFGKVLGEQAVRYSDSLLVGAERAGSPGSDHARHSWRSPRAHRLPPGNFAENRRRSPKLVEWCRIGVRSDANRRGAMSFTSVAAVAVAALLVSCGAATAAGPFRPFQSGLWSGGAYTDDRTGGFSHCSAGVAYDSGINMFVVSTEAHGSWLGFTNPQWALPPGANMPIRLRFDQQPSMDAAG